MGKYLELFRSEVGDLTEKTKLENKPYIAYSTKLDKVTYTVVPKPADPNTYVTFTAEEDNSSIRLSALSTYQTMEYSMDTTTWNTFDTTTNISLNNGDKVYVRGMLSADNGEYNCTSFKMTGKIAASGNCNALWNYQDLNAPLKAYCGSYMFNGCKSLTTAPELTTTTLAKHCYYMMFSDCDSLTAAPKLPATTLYTGCYAGMFRGCNSLTTAPELPATVLAGACYQNMFTDCISLATAPELPATVLAYYCYCDMFNGCISLTTAPELPATTLDINCYYGMFSGCSSLTAASELPATTLQKDCYRSMFKNCTNLNHIVCLATDISAARCTYDWVNKVSSTGTFVKHPSMNGWTTGTDGIPSGWTVVDAEL